MHVDGSVYKKCYSLFFLGMAKKPNPMGFWPDATRMGRVRGEFFLARVKFRYRGEKLCQNYCTKPYHYWNVPKFSNDTIPIGIVPYRNVLHDTGTQSHNEFKLKISILNQTPKNYNHSSHFPKLNLLYFLPLKKFKTP